MSGNTPISIYVPQFNIAVNAAPLASKVLSTVTGISVTLDINPPGQFSITLDDADMMLIDLDNGVLIEGSRIEISMGYVNNVKKVITGEISAVTANFSDSGNTSVKVEGFDLLHRLTRGTCYRKFEGSAPDSGMPDSDIASMIALEMGLSPCVDDTPALKTPRVQDNVSDFTILEELAKLNNFYLWAENDNLFFKSDRPTPNYIELGKGISLLSFSRRVSTTGLVNEVEVRGWDPTQKHSFFYRQNLYGMYAGKIGNTGCRQINRGSGGKSELVMTDTCFGSENEAQRYAAKIMDNQQRNLERASGSSMGNPDIKVGTTLKLSGIGRFEGVYMVEQVTHTIDSNGFRSFFEMREK